MNGKSLLAGLCLVVLTIAATPARAQDASGQLAENIAGINRSLERMVAMLETLIDNQRVDILLKRIELKERRLEPLESELRRTERAITDVEARIKRLNEEKEELDDAIADDVRAGTDSEDSESRRMKMQLERVIETENARTEDMRRQVNRLEDQLADGREELAILDEQLQALLE